MNLRAKMAGAQCTNPYFSSLIFFLLKRPSKEEDRAACPEKKNFLMYFFIYIYAYIYKERETERERGGDLF